MAEVTLPLRGQKAGLFEGGIRVPCLMRWPAKIQPGTKFNSVVSALDFFPTFCALANVEDSSANSDGTDLLGVISGEQEFGSRELFFELGRHITFPGKSWYALRKGDWKYVQTDSGDEFLFDIDSDPNEKTDIKDQHADVFAMMKARTFELAESFRNATDRPVSGSVR